MAGRLAKIRDRAYEVAVEFGVEDVAVEQYSVGPRKRSGIAHTYYLHGQVGMKLWENGFGAPLMIAPPTLKKWITDDGRAEKEEVRAHLEEMLGIELHKDHNVVDADALGVMLAQFHLYEEGEFAPTKYQLEKMRNWQRML